MQTMGNINPYEVLHPTSKSEKPQGRFYDAIEAIEGKLEIYKKDQESRIEQFQKLEKSSDIDNHIMVLNSRLKFVKDMAADVLQLLQLFYQFESNQVTPEAIAEARNIVARISAKREDAISSRFIGEAHLPTVEELNAIKEKIEYYQVFDKTFVKKAEEAPAMEPEQPTTTKTAVDFIETEAERRYAEAKEKYEKSSLLGKAYLKLSGQANFKKMEADIKEGMKRS